MKKFIIPILHWLYIQAYVSLTVLFSSKARLVEIALRGGNHPLVIFGISRHLRIWWLSILGIVFWLIWFSPWLNLIIFGGPPKTFFGEVTHHYTVIILGKYTLNFASYWIGSVFAGVILQYLEVWSDNKMKYFQSYLGSGLVYRSTEETYYDNEHFEELDS